MGICLCKVKVQPDDNQLLELFKNEVLSLYENCFDPEYKKYTKYNISEIIESHKMHRDLINAHIKERLPFEEGAFSEMQSYEDFYSLVMKCFTECETESETDYETLRNKLTTIATTLKKKLSMVIPLNNA